MSRSPAAGRWPSPPTAAGSRVDACRCAQGRGGRLANGGRGVRQAGEAGRAGREDTTIPPVQPHPASWNRDEWDVSLSDGAVYRIFRDRVTDGWFIDAIAGLTTKDTRRTQRQLFLYVSLSFVSLVSFVVKRVCVLLVHRAPHRLRLQLSARRVAARSPRRSRRRSRLSGAGAPRSRRRVRRPPLSQGRAGRRHQADHRRRADDRDQGAGEAGGAGRQEGKMSDQTSRLQPTRPSSPVRCPSSAKARTGTGTCAGSSRA